jgi:hypothetical protein
MFWEIYLNFKKFLLFDHFGKMPCIVKHKVSIYRWNQHYISFKMRTKNLISGDLWKYVNT